MKVHKIINITLIVLAFFLSILIFLKNAWITDDAYINFRSLEQLFAGNGPNWNPHERVQVYTSPLWYYSLGFIRLFTPNYYLSTLLFSLTLWIVALLIILKTLKNGISFFLATLAVVGSNAFYDYTSSGLENVLGYLLISIFLLIYLRLFEEKDEPHNYLDQSKLNIILALFVFGLLVLTRHDLATLLLPAMTFVIVKYWQTFPLKKWGRWIVLAFLPFGTFTLFSLVYYGFPFPNTAYAKLSTGIRKGELIQQGFNYLYVSLRDDTLTMGIILAALIISITWSRRRHITYLGAGVLLNIAYIVSVGGDFMKGRFLSYSFLTSLIVLVLWLASRKSKWFIGTALVLFSSYTVLFSHTPVNSPLEYKNRDTSFGISDERGYYFNSVSLYKLYRWDPETFPFPIHPMTQLGREFKQSDIDITVESVIGIFGFHAGTEKIIIDPLALADPFLARLPAEEDWRIGHYNRHFPQGYLESVKSGENLIEDPDLREYYDHLSLVVQSPELFSPKRLVTILNFNLGRYDYLLP